MPVIATYCISSRTQLCIEKIEYDSEDYIIFYEYDCIAERKGKRCKSCVQYTAKGQPYFIHHKRRIYLDECIKVG